MDTSRSFNSHAGLFFALFLILQSVAIFLPLLIQIQTGGHFGFIFLATLIPALSLIWLNKISGPQIWLAVLLAVLVECGILFLLQSVSPAAIAPEFFRAHGWPGLFFSAGMAVFTGITGSIAVYYRRGHESLEFRRLPRTLDEKRRLFEQRSALYPDKVSEFRYESLLSACTGFIAEQSGEILASVQMIVKNGDRYFFDLISADERLARELLIFATEQSEIVGGMVRFLAGVDGSSYLPPLTNSQKQLVLESGFRLLLSEELPGVQHALDAMFYMEKTGFFPFQGPLEVYIKT